MLPEPLYTPPSKQEMQARLERVRSMMEDQEITHYVVTCPDSVFYLTNFANYVHERPFIIVVSLEGPLLFVVPKREIPHVEIRSIGDIELVEYFEFPATAGKTWEEALQSIFPSESRVGVEAICPLQVFQALPGNPKRTETVEDARLVKSEYEIARIVYASNLATEAMEQFLGAARPGMGMGGMASICKSKMLGQTMADYPETNMLATNAGFALQPPSVSHDPHNFTDISMTLAEGGPNVTVVNGTLNGYGTEVERTIFLGHVPDDAKKPFEVMMAAREKAFELATPGNVMHEVDYACNSIFREAGYEDFLLHRTGHSIGVTGHEAPFLAEGYHRVIEPGMLFTIEPGVYLPGIGGFRHSDTVLITEDGNVSLTPVASSLKDMTLDLA